VCPAAAKGVDRGFNHVRGGVEVGLADFEMNNVAAFGFKGSGPHENFKSGLGSQALHAFCKTEWERLARDFGVVELNCRRSHIGSQPLL
jgi:hypothetical protein